MEMARPLGRGKRISHEGLVMSTMDQSCWWTPPGIEGGEGQLRQRTQAAVRKAHVVAVVTGTGKEPESGALHKVAKDAQRAGEILSILNVRGRPTAYKRRSTLGTRDTPKLEERIRLAMSQVFSDRHTDHLNLNAYLAFVAASRGTSGFPSRQHQRDREHTAEIFGTLDQAAAFSGIGELAFKLDELVREARPRILWGNGLKAVTALGEVSSTFFQAASSLDDAAKLWNKAVREAKAQSSKAIKRSRAKVGQKISLRLSRLSGEQKETVKDGVERSLSSSTLKRKFRSAIKSAEPDLKDIFEEECKALQEDLKVEMDRLHQRMNVQLFVIDFDLPDMDEILRNVSRSVGKEMLDDIVSVLSAVLTRLSTVLMILTRITALLGRIWERFGGGKRKREREARTKAGRLIDREMAKVRKTMKGNLDEEWGKLDAQILSHLDAAEQLTSAFQNASDSLKEEAITPRRRRHAAYHAFPEDRRQRPGT